MNEVDETEGDNAKEEEDVIEMEIHGEGNPVENEVGDLGHDSGVEQQDHDDGDDRAADMGANEDEDQPIRPTKKRKR
jgi:hypothetical protein